MVINVSRRGEMWAEAPLLDDPTIMCAFSAYPGDECLDLVPFGHCSICGKDDEHEPLFASYRHGDGFVHASCTERS